MTVILLLQINFGLFTLIFLFCLVRNFNFNIILVGLTYLLPLIPWWLGSAHAERMLIVSYSNFIFGIIEVVFFTLTEKPEDIRFNKAYLQQLFGHVLPIVTALLGMSFVSRNTLIPVGVVELSMDNTEPVAGVQFNLNSTLNDFSINQVSGTTLSIGETTTIIEGGWDWFKLSTLIKYSTEETPFSQPRNRISTTIRSSDFVTIQLGDFTPVINPYLVQGKRVRGIGVNIDLKSLKLQTISGELERPVQGYLSNDRSYLITEINIDSTGLNKYAYFFFPKECA